MQTFGSKRCALAATLGYNESNLEPNPKEQTAKQFAGPLHIRLVWAKKYSGVQCAPYSAWFGVCRLSTHLLLCVLHQSGRTT